MVVWDIVKNSEKKIILRSMRSGEILCKYGAKEKIPKEMREKGLRADMMLEDFSL